MFAAENYALNNEVHRTYILVPFRYTHQRECECLGLGRRSTWQHKKPSTVWKASYVVSTCSSTYIFGLPALVSGFLFMSMWGMRTNRIILCCFGDKSEMVGHIPKIICHGCRFRVTPWKLRIAHHRYTMTRDSVSASA